MEDNVKRKRGAPYGNKNALKHGFYARGLQKESRRKMKQAFDVTGLDEEIALLRYKLEAAIDDDDPENLRVISQGLLALNRLLRTRQKIVDTGPEGFRKGIRYVLESIAVPLGIGLPQHGVRPPPESEKTEE